MPLRPAVARGVGQRLHHGRGGLGGQDLGDGAPEQVLALPGQRRRVLRPYIEIAPVLVQFEQQVRNGLEGRIQFGVAVEQILLGVLERGDVHVEAVHFRFAESVEQPGVAGIDVGGAAVLAPQHQLAGRNGHALGHPALDIGADLFAQVRRNDQVFQRPPERLGAGIAVQGLAGGIPVNHPAMTVVALHGNVVDGFEEDAEAGIVLMRGRDLVVHDL